MFSADELALLQNFAKNAAKEDKKLHGIQDNASSTKKPVGGFYAQDKSKTVSTSTNINKTNILNQKKEEKKPAQTINKTEPPRPNTSTKPIPKKEEKKPEPVKSAIQPKKEEKKPEPVKPTIQPKKEEKSSNVQSHVPPKKEYPIPGTINPPPKVEFAKFPNASIPKPKEQTSKVPQNAVHTFANKSEPPKVETKKVEPPKVEPKKVEPPKVEPKKIDLAKKFEPPKKTEPPKVEPKKVEPPKKLDSKKLEFTKIETKQVAQTEPNNNNNKNFSSLRDTLLKNMQERDKPVESKPPSEPVKVMKSDDMKKMLEAMNKHFEEGSESSEPTKLVVVEGGGPVPPPPPPPGVGVSSSTSSVNPDPLYIPPPPPPPPPPIFDPSKVPKKPNKPIPKKIPPKSSNQSSGGGSSNARPSLKEQLMRVSLKKVGK